MITYCPVTYYIFFFCGKSKCGIMISFTPSKRQKIQVHKRMDRRWTDGRTDRQTTKRLGEEEGEGEEKDGEA